MKRDTQETSGSESAEELRGNLALCAKPWRIWLSRQTGGGILESDSYPRLKEVKENWKRSVSLDCLAWYGNPVVSWEWKELVCFWHFLVTLETPELSKESPTSVSWVYVDTYLYLQNAQEDRKLLSILGSFLHEEAQQRSWQVFLFKSRMKLFQPQGASVSVVVSATILKIISPPFSS